MDNFPVAGTATHNIASNNNGTLKHKDTACVTGYQGVQESVNILGLISSVTWLQRWHGMPEALGLSTGRDFLPPVTHVNVINELTKPMTVMT